MTATLRNLGIPPEFTATPGRADSTDAERREHRAAPEADPPREAPIDARAHTAAAVETWRQMEQLAARDSLAGVIDSRVVIGRNEAGNIPDGASDAWWRPPLPWQDAHHDQPIAFNGRTQYQQAPPVHVPGAVYSPARETTRRIRTVTEAQAQRILLAAELLKVPRAIVAEVAGMEPNELRREITTRRKRAAK